MGTKMQPSPLKTLQQVSRLTVEAEGLLSPSQAASLLGVHRGRVHQLIDGGKLEVFEVLGSRFVSVRGVKARLKQAEVGFDKGGRPPVAQAA